MLFVIELELIPPNTLLSFSICKKQPPQSLVYFYKYYNEDGTITFLANSDAAIVQGLIAIMLKVFSGKKPQEIMDTNINFLEQLGLNDHLSSTRKNGLSSLVSSIKNSAKEKLT